MGTTTAKAFLLLAGMPLLIYSLRTLVALRHMVSLILVVGRDERILAEEVLRQHGPWPVPIQLVDGGAERQDSVAAGLAIVDEMIDLVIVHDAARPFVSRACVEACVEAARVSGAAIVAMPAHDTVKLLGEDEAIDRTLDRRRVWLAQTPQIFRTALMRQAYAQAQRDGYRATDDAALVERLGVKVRVVPGESTNQKVTTPDDLRWAEWYLHAQRT